MENKCCCPFCEYERREEKRKALHNTIDNYVRECVQKQQADNKLGVYEKAYAQKIEQLCEELKTRMEQQTEKPPYEKNFCRVFELPDRYPEGFCFGVGKPVMMLMVDWFNPWPDNPDLKTWDDVTKLLLPFLRKKVYVKPGKRYILITDFGASLVFEKEK